MKFIRKILLLIVLMFSFHNVSSATLPEGDMIGDWTLIRAEQVYRYTDGDFGGNMTYVYYEPRNREVYIIVHGTKDGLVMNGVSPKKAVRQIMEKSKHKFAKFDKISFICCYSNQHKGFYSKEYNCEVDFPVNSNRQLILKTGKHHFRYGEWE